MIRLAKTLVAAAILGAPFAATTPVQAQLALSANDGKQVREGEPMSSARADDIILLDLSTSPARVVSSVEAANSMIGPPTSIAVARSGRFALVTASLKWGEASPPALVAGEQISMVDLSTPSRPRVTQHLNAGPNVSGVAISDDGRLALAVSAGDDAVHVFSIRSGRLRPVQRLALDKGAKPIDVDIAPDGRTALVALQNQNRILRLAIAGGRVSPDGSFAPGRQPYGVTIDRSGAYAYVSLLGGRQPPAGAPRSRVGAVAVLDLKGGALGEVVDVGVTPEHIAVSPDGRHLLVVLINGSNLLPTSPNFKDFGFIKVLRIEGDALTPVAEARTGGWCQGATWSSDSRRVFVQCTTDRQIEVFGFDGAALTRLPEETLSFAGRPGSIATAASR